MARGSLDLFLGNAARDATPMQRAQLQTTVPPLLRGEYLATGDELAVRCAVADIMGWKID